MLVITVARKPLEGSVAANAIKHGCGGLNIDATRIATTEDFSDVKGRPILKLTNLNPDKLDTPEQQEALRKLKTLGRWPANVVLSHLGGCQCVGTINVRRDLRDATANVITGEGRFGHMAGSKAIGTTIESIQVWQCESGCPVAALDDQSGIVPTGTWNRQKDTAHPFGNAKDTPYETWRQPPKEAPGGASRFFKVIR